VPESLTIIPSAQKLLDSLRDIGYGASDGIERVEYEVNLDGAGELVVAPSPGDFSPPPP